MEKEVKFDVLKKAESYIEKHKYLLRKTSNLVDCGQIHHTYNCADLEIVTIQNLCTSYYDIKLMWKGYMISRLSVTDDSSVDYCNQFHNYLEKVNEENIAIAKEDFMLNS